MRLLVAVTALLLAGACGSDSGSSDADGAGEAVQELLTSMDAGSCPDVQRIVLTPDLIDCEQIETLSGSYTDRGVDLDDLSVTTGEVVDNSVTVTVGLGGGEPDETWQAERVDGSWRVVFDSEA